ncbi:hypothetical protein [Flavobacterium johnsoniae]|uniref:Tail tube protein n=1 Tax=Flavobacterium johnsoniae TaxID=986 RepID=A0A1M5VIL7_FLAJO|nr:hypothetical protein [Flavobacterium johnsoniae]SHH75099.1 hypothetical protein SAMN05444388_1183 [Flavobacterium johnsoniae]
MATPTVVNKFGTMQGWNSITVNMLGRDVEGITQLKYTDTVTKENVKGGGLYPVGRSVTDYEAEASITLYKEEADALRASLPKGKRIQDIASFDITVDYAKPDGVITRDRIRNCEFTNDGVEVSQGDGTIATEYTLIVSHIEYNVI